MNEELDRRLRRKRATQLPAVVAKAALSGAVPGAMLGGAKGFIEGRPLSGILRGAAGGAALTGGVSGLAVGTGHSLMGPADEGDEQAYGDRGLVGGIASGGGIGAGLGALAAAGLMKLPKDVRKNALARYFAKLVERGGPSAIAKGAGLGAGIGAGYGGYTGWSEGTGLDSIESQLRRRREEEGLA